jgi:plastocyanin
MRNFARAAGFSALVPLAGAVAALAGETARIVINDLEFAPSALTLRVGDVIAWTNRDIVDHTITAKNGAFDVVTPVGKTGRLRLGKAGTFSYYCRFHPNMTGTIIVTE